MAHREPPRPTFYVQPGQGPAPNDLYVDGRLEDLRVGDVVSLYGRYGHHSATIQIEKINRKSVVGREIATSYRAGREWRIAKGATAFVVNGGYTEPDRYAYLKEIWNQ